MNLHFDLLAPFYDRAIRPPGTDRLAAALRLPTTGWLLDAGGGTGRVSSPLQPLVGRLVISDLSVPMLEQARVKGVACPVQSYAERLPFPDHQFDRVLVVDAMHHFADQRQAIGELLRVLKPGGRLVIEEPDIALLRVKLVAWAEKLALMGSRFYAPHDLAVMVSAYGFSAAVQPHDAFSAWVMVDKPSARSAYASSQIT